MECVCIFLGRPPDWDSAKKVIFTLRCCAMKASHFCLLLVSARERAPCSAHMRRCAHAASHVFVHAHARAHFRSFLPRIWPCNVKCLMEARYPMHATVNLTQHMICAHK
eukprot:3006472-Pleurochrysis_carterae.AAC.1